LVKYLLQIVLIVGIFVSLFSCEDDGYSTSTDVMLRFSTDTITFDTVFTSVGSTTKRFTVANPYDEDILISSVQLAGGSTSNYRLNINGYEENELTDIEIPAKDSIYIFVEVTIDPNGQNTPMVVKDSIQFITNTNLQEVKLIAYGQDFELINSQKIGTTTWTADKPYLVYEYAYVDSLATLTINPGAKIYFHDGAGLYVKGNLIANGTYDQPITFLGDRLETSYADIPDQWNGIVLYSGSHDNVLNYTTIKNANIGLQVGTLEDDGYASLTLSNSCIENMAYAGLFAMKSKISGYNDVIANCGYYAAALLIGGEYEFYHTTIVNYWSYSSGVRTTSSLVISNVLYVDDDEDTQMAYSGDLVKATFANSIIYGNYTSELSLGDNDDNTFNYLFDHCIIRAVADSFDVSNTDHFVDVMMGSDYNPQFVDVYDEYNYQLDTLSPAKDAGSAVYGELYPLDLLNESRISDEAPDLGAYERIEKTDDDD
jgi:hypothetical protein